MQGRKIFICAILFMALCLSACEKNPSEFAEAESVTAAEGTVMDFGTETFSAAETEASEKGTETEASETEQTKPKKFSDEDIKNYFAEHGYQWEKYNNLYVDMADFADGTEPLEGLNEEYLKKARTIRILNADNSDLSFISKYPYIYHVYIENYSGNCDLSVISAFSIHFDNYKGGDLRSMKDVSVNYISFENYDGNSDLSGIAEMSNIHSVWFENYSVDTDFSFLSECKNITDLKLENKSIDAEKLTEILKNSNIGNLYVKVVDYFSDDAKMLMKAAPTCAISYNMDDSPWRKSDKTPTEGFVVYVNPEIIPGYPEDEWECITLEAKPSYEKGWEHKGELVCVFSNFTNEIKTADRVQIFRNNGDSFTEMPFSDGNTVLEIDFSVAPRTETDFVLTDDMFPYEKCEPGIYKAVFDCGGEKLEQTFFINYPYADNPDYQSYYELSLNFLTEEQNELFENTIAELNEEISYGRGHDITVFGVCFEPLYSDENEVLFKNTVIHAFEYSYFIWFEEYNFHMVKTEDGWRFDNFQLWY